MAHAESGEVCASGGESGVTGGHEKEDEQSLHEGSELEAEFKYPQVVGREKLRFLQKRQKKGQQRYFDSADYNMARARAHVTTPREFPAVPQNDTGEAIPTVESLPPRNAAIEQSKLATLTLF
ncbi:cAMP-regulated phosphoprotein 19-like [Ixodes scapularis]